MRAMSIPNASSAGTPRTTWQKTLLCASLLLSLGTVGCQPSSFELTLDLTEQRQNAQPAGAISTLLPTPFVFAVNLADEAKIRGANPPRQVFLKEFSLVISSTTRPAGDVDTFDYLNTAEFFIEPTRVGSVLQKVKVADIPAKEGPTGEMWPRLIANLNLLPLLTEGAQLTSTATGTTPGDDVSYTGKVVLSVDVF
jgi:hypothetical protein